MSKIERNALWITALFYIGAGVSHFLFTEMLAGIVPAIVPMKQTVIYATGVIEIILGFALLNPGSRNLAVNLITLMLLSFLWVHVDMFIKKDFYIELFQLEQYTSSPDLLFSVRIAVQFVMIWWVRGFFEE